MKKITLLFALVVCFAFTANAQTEQGQIRLGAGLALGTKAAVDESGEKAGIGINIGGEYLITDAISVAPSYTFFFESEVDVPGASSSLKASSFNVDGRYYFTTDGPQFYALAGLSFATAKASVTADVLGTPITIEADDNETGLNIGGGVVLPMGDSMGLNGQIKYNTPFEQLVISAGLVFQLN